MDRGKQSLVTMTLQLAYKPKYPVNFFLLRGNHECASIMRIYGFYDECKRRYNIKTWKQFCDVFNCFPICGLSPEISIMDQVRRLGRPMDVPDTGIIYDLLWTDPDKDITGLAENDRGVSFIPRQVVEDGYEFLAKQLLITVFSAPNYYGEFDNTGVTMAIDVTLMCSFKVLRVRLRSCWRSSTCQ